MTTPLLPGPRPTRCRCCHRPIKVGPVIDGYGETCARQRGLLPPHIPKPRSEGQDGPDLFDAARENGEFVAQET